MNKPVKHVKPKRRVEWSDHVLKGQKRRTVAQKMTNAQKKKDGRR